MGRQGATNDQARALALTALTDAGRGDSTGARSALGRATALVQGSQDLLARLTVDLAAAKMNPGGEAALRSLAGRATRAGMLELRLEAELALAQRAAQGKGDGGTQLAALRKEAENLGYGAIAQKARRE